MAAPLSAYELTRAETIRKNNAFLMSLGLLDDVEAMRPTPKPKPAPKPKPTQTLPSGPSRRSSRLDGQPAEEVFELDEAEDTDTPPKAPHDPFHCWWTVSKENPEGTARRPRLTSLQLKALQTPLRAADRESLNIDGDDEWVTDLLKFARAYGGQRPEPFCVPSRENFGKVLDSVSVLASEEGVTCPYRSGAFDAGRRYTPRDDLDEALARALKWLPKAKDKSRGWVFTHPFEKLKQYQRALFWRHLFPFVWPDAPMSSQAEEAAIAHAEGCTGDEATAWLRMAGLASAESSDEDEDGEEGENAPLAKRKKTG